MKKIYNIFGPNLNMLGYRNKSNYGTLDYNQLCSHISNYALENNIEIINFQANSEEKIIEYIHNIIITGDDVDIIVNLGAFTHYSYAISDALEMLLPKSRIVEVHLSDISKREDFRKISVLSHIRSNLFFGEKEKSYVDAIDFLIN